MKRAEVNIAVRANRVASVYTHHKVLGHVVSFSEQVLKVVLKLRAAALVRLKVETVQFQQPFFLLCQLTFFLLLELSVVERHGHDLKHGYGDEIG